MDRRGRGTKPENKVEKMKWSLILDSHKSYLHILAAKGYNHVNESQSKENRPNLHFKLINLDKNAKGRGAPWGKV